MADYSRILNDKINLSESISRLSARIAILTDSVKLSDMVLPSQILLISLTDGISLSDTLTHIYFKQAVNLISCDVTTSRIYVHSGVAGRILTSFASPATKVSDITFYDNHLISCDILTDKIYIHSGLSTTISNSFASPSNNPSGLTYDGTNLISCDSVLSKIYIHEKITSIINNSFASPASNPTGLAITNNGHLISCDKTSNKIYIHSGISSVITNSWYTPPVLPDGTPYGVAFDGVNVISCDYETSTKIYVYSGISSTVSNSFSSPDGSPTGLAYSAYRYRREIIDAINTNEAIVVNGAKVFFRMLIDGAQLSDSITVFFRLTSVTDSRTLTDGIIFNDAISKSEITNIIERVLSDGITLSESSISTYLEYLRIITDSIIAKETRIQSDKININYDLLKATYTREPVTLVVMTLDYCSLTFGTSPCTATGTECYNTYPTCADQSNYTKTTKQYKFSMKEGRLQSNIEARPYLKKINYIPTEISPQSALTQRSKLTLTFDDENDNDVGIDPYVNSRSNVQGTFWKKLKARNKNYRGRLIEIKKGFYSTTFNEGDFVTKFAGIITNIEINSQSETKIIARDLLYLAEDVYAPVLTDGKLLTAMTSYQLFVYISSGDGSQYGDSGYIRINDEIIRFTSRTNDTLIIPSGGRGQYNTTAANHDIDAPIQLCLVWDSVNGVDICLDILDNYLNIDNIYIDRDIFENERDAWLTDFKFTAVLTEPIKISEMLKDISQLMLAYIWWDEDKQKITFKAFRPIAPGNTGISTINDNNNIINKSMSIDDRDENRITRIIVQYGKNPVKAVDEFSNFSTQKRIIDLSAESENEYNEVKTLQIQSHWLSDDSEGDSIALFFAGRTLIRFRDATKIITFRLDIKDESLAVGDIVIINTDAIQDKNGAAINDKYEIIRKQWINDREIQYKAMDTKLSKRYGFIGPNTLPADYDDATDDEKEYAFVGDSNNKVGNNNDDGYYIW